MEKIFTIVVLFLAFMNATNAQNPLVFEPMDSPQDTGDYDFLKKDLIKYNNTPVLAHYGAFMPISGVPESQCLFFIDNTGKICTFPGAKNFLQVFSIINDNAGDILFGTDNGLFKLSTSGLQVLYGTGYRVKLVFQSINGIIYFTEEDPANASLSNVTRMMHASPEGVITQLDVKSALLGGYREFGDSGFATYSVQEGKSPEEGDYFFAINLNTLQEIVGFKPPNDESYFGGYGEAVIAYGKYFVRVSKIGTDGALVSWDGTDWVETIFDHEGPLYPGGKIREINGYLYTGPLRINSDMGEEAIPVIEEAMVWCDLEWFNNTWYLSSPGLSQLRVGPVTTSIDSFSWNITEYLPGCLARITTSTEISDHPGDQISIYPNPAHDVLNIEGISSVDYVSIFDMVGTLVLTATTKAINVSEVPTGVYLLSVSTSEKIFNAPIIIEH